MIKMPIMKRVPIPTKGIPWYKRAINVIFSRLEWELVEDFYFKIPSGTFRVKAPFFFDGASVPRIFWWIPGLSPVGILLIQGLIHDAFYKNGFVELIYPDGSIDSWGLGCGQKVGDDLLLMVGKIAHGVIIINYVAYAAVRVGGWNAWRKYRKND